MSDLLLHPGFDGGDLILKGNGEPKTTSGLEVAVYLSLFTSVYWGNAIEEPAGRFESTIPELYNESLSNRTRLQVVAAAKRSLAWMLDNGIAESIEARAEIVGAERLNLAVTLQEPQGRDPLTFVYSINWRAQEASLI